MSRGGVQVRARALQARTGWAFEECLEIAREPELGPKQVEALVTRPIESAVNGVSGFINTATATIRPASSVRVT